MKNKFILCILTAFFVLFAFSRLEAEPQQGPPSDDELMQFQPPQECFMTFFGPDSTPVGQPSCAKKITRFKLDEINMSLQQSASIMEAAKNAAILAGFDMSEGSEIDLVQKMQEFAEQEQEGAQFESQDIGFTVTKALLSRGIDQTIDGALYQIWSFEGGMTTSMGGRTFSDIIEMEIALNLGDPDTTRIIEQTMSFGSGSNFMQGIIITKTATGAPVSLNLNYEMQDSGGENVFDCQNPGDPETCVNNFNHSFEQTIALAQEFNAEGDDSGKMQWTESGDGGEPLPPEEVVRESIAAVSEKSPLKEEGPPPTGGSFNNTMSGGWDSSGAGCLEMEQDFDAVFEANDQFAGSGGAHCGPFVDGSDLCENYKQGRTYSAILKVDDGSNVMFKDCDASGICEIGGPLEGDLPPEFQDLGGGPPPEQGFNCGNVAVTNYCDGHCPDGVPPTPPDPTSAANNTSVQAWLMGCFEGLMFDDSGITAGFGGSSRKAECWDSAGLVHTSSDNYNFDDRDGRIDGTFDYRDNFDNEREIEYERPADACRMYFDDTRNVEVIQSTGVDFCIPDAFASNNQAAAGTPLCSQAGRPSC